MWITHDQLCELYDRLEDARRGVPFYKFMTRYVLIIQRNFTGYMIETIESIARDQGELARKSNCGCRTHTDHTAN